MQIYILAWLVGCRYYWKFTIPTPPPPSQSVGRSFCRYFLKGGWGEVTLPCSYQGTCFIFEARAAFPWTLISWIWAEKYALDLGRGEAKNEEKAEYSKYIYSTNDKCWHYPLFLLPIMWIFSLRGFVIFSTFTLRWDFMKEKKFKKNYAWNHDEEKKNKLEEKT